MRTRMSRRQLASMLAAVSAGFGVVPVAGVTSQVTTPAATPQPGGSGKIDGVAGGGTVEQMGIEVLFSLMAFSVPGPDSEALVGGFLRLVDDSTPNHPLVVEATEIVSIELLSTRSAAGRQVTGYGTLNTYGRYPFMLQVEDLGEPGSGEDRFNLVLGDAAAPFLGGKEFSGCDCGGLGYAIRGNVTQGDIAVIGKR